MKFNRIITKHKNEIIIISVLAVMAFTGRIVPELYAFHLVLLMVSAITH